MEEKRSLILSEGDNYGFPELNCKIKLTPVMEEVLWTLQVLFLLLFTTSFTNIVKFLCKLLNRSPNAIGSTLQSLANLGLLDYYRSGRKRVVTLHLDHPYLTSSLFRFFGFNDWLLDQDYSAPYNEQGCFGFLPSEKNVQKFCSFLQQKEQKLDEKITNYQESLDWIEKIKQTIATADIVLLEDFEEAIEHPIHLFSEEIVTRIKQAEVPRANHLAVEELADIILSVFADFREEPPWIDESYLHQHAFWKGDQQLERLHADK